MVRITNNRYQGHYLMHAGGDYVRSTLSGLLHGFVVGFLVGIRGCVFSGELIGGTPRAELGKYPTCWAICAVIGAVWRFVRLRREDAAAKEESLKTTIEEMARLVMDDEEVDEG